MFAMVVDRGRLLGARCPGGEIRTRNCAAVPDGLASRRTFKDTDQHPLQPYLRLTAEVPFRHKPSFRIPAERASIHDPALHRLNASFYPPMEPCLLGDTTQWGRKKEPVFVVSIFLLLDKKLVNFFTYIKASISYNSVYLISACLENFAVTVTLNILFLPVK